MLDPPLDADEDHVLGDPDAPLQLVMFGDFQCPYCAAAQGMLRRVRDRLDDRLLFAFRHLPIPEVHPDAQTAAEAAEAAAAQGAFWPFHDRLFAAGGRLGRADLVRHARDLGLDANRLEHELDGHVHAERVERDLRSARALGAGGTPAFVANGKLHGGSFDAGSLVEALTR